MRAGSHRPVARDDPPGVPAGADRPELYPPAQARADERPHRPGHDAARSLSLPGCRCPRPRPSALWCRRRRARTSRFTRARSPAATRRRTSAIDMKEMRRNRRGSSTKAKARQPVLVCLTRRRGGLRAYGLAHGTLTLAALDTSTGSRCMRNGSSVDTENSLPGIGTHTRTEHRLSARGGLGNVRLRTLRKLPSVIATTDLRVIGSSRGSA